MVDLFDEVEEEMRAEQYKRLALRLAPWLLGGLLAGALIAGGIYGYRKYEENNAAKASTAFSAVLNKINAGDTAGAYKQLDTVPKAAKAYKALAYMIQAQLRLGEDKPADAVKLLDQAAEAAPRGDAGLILADSARLKAAWAVMDDAPFAETEKRLKPLTEDGRPYRALATEALAMAMLNAGKPAEARSLFNKLSIDPTAPQGLTQRAKAAVGMIDSGSVASLPAAVKTAKTLPPPAPMMGGGQLPPEILEQLRAQAQAQAAQGQGQAQGQPGAAQ